MTEIASTKTTKIAAKEAEKLALAQAPSPCIGVCKYTLGDRCRGCTMTKADKRAFKKLSSPKDKSAFFVMLAGRLVGQSRYPKWAKKYRKRCEKRGAPCVLDAIEPRLGLANTGKYTPRQPGSKQSGSKKPAV